ncbi:MAG: hypothetical protein HOO93_02880 [Methyloglobulus sp.]|nr:hypothetical protein [Methyloglobulus sp.]
MNKTTKLLGVILSVAGLALTFNVNAKDDVSGGGGTTTTTTNAVVLKAIIPGVGRASPSIRGNTAVITASDQITQAQRTYVYQRTNGVWSRQAEIIPTETNINVKNRFWGRIVGDNTLVMFSFWDGITYNYVFRRTGTVWRQESSFVLSDASGNSFLGTTDDTRLMATGANTANPAVQVYVRTVSAIGVVSWIKQATLSSAKGNFDFMNFGNSLVAADTVLIPGIEKATGRGVVFSFKRTNGVWSEQSLLKPTSLLTVGAIFPWRIVLDGDTAVVGATINDLSTAKKVYVFKRTGSTWSEQGVLKDDRYLGGSLYGMNMGISGDLVVVNDSISGYDSGSGGRFSTPPSFVVFKRDATTNQWSLLQRVFANSNKYGFGTPVDISGTTILTPRFSLLTSPITQEVQAYEVTTP